MDIYEQLERAQGQLAYVQDMLEQDIEQWERKEYQTLETDYLQQIEHLHTAITHYESIYLNQHA